MQIFRAVCIGLFCILLQSCASIASVQYSEHFELGKLQYARGNYKQAFHELLPVAVSGNAQAQYAVGYMYYYGYGVPRDTESGLFWMQRADAQNYRPAIKALYLISLRPCTCGEEVSIGTAYRGASSAVYDRLTHQTTSCDAYRKAEASEAIRAIENQDCHPYDVTRRDEVLYSLNRPYPLSRSTCSTCLHKPVSLEKLVPSPCEKLYALQLFGAYTFAQVKRLQQELCLQKKTHIWHTFNQSRDWYVLTYGKYVSVTDAKLAEAELPEELKELCPWIRKINGLERMM